MEVLRKAPDPIFDSNLILEFLDFGDDDDDKNDGMAKRSGSGWRVLAQGPRNELRLGLSRTSVYESTESDVPGPPG